MRFESAGTVLDVGRRLRRVRFSHACLGQEGRGGRAKQGLLRLYCREELGLDVRTAHLGPDLFEGESFDLIRLNHVLEHLNDPVKYLAMIRAWLAPGGVLYIEVPNIEEECRIKTRGNIFHYGHIWNFNPWTLRAVAGLAGLGELDATRERSADTTGVVFRIGPVCSAVDLVNTDNAARVRDLIARHYAGDFIKGKAVKPLVNLAARIEEVSSGFFAGTPREIGMESARSLQVDVPKF